ncbi:MAG TPA: cupredoxin domain-containing protein [Candidatus Limnocylindrales bacterium]|nr:cupredoxin domain-containing protein [Candidatus Limnocylindrales bacterium]
MTDQLPPEERLPAPRPAEPGQLSAERFTAAPPVKSTAGLTPERAAGIVRQSSSARWVSFLAVAFVTLFVVGYWFYELGAPLGISEPRLATEIERQQVTAVERGYNIYQANCARCHGVDGEGGIGPVLNSQEKLFSHLNENYLRNVLEVGGRYVCGNPASLMPAWSDTANPPGPLNYRQIDELIAFLRATNEHEYVVKDPSLNEPIVDPETGEEQTFTGWRDPNYKPDPAATPYPDCYLDAIGGGGGGGSPAPTASVNPEAPTVTVVAPVGSASTGFDPTTLEVAADTAFTLIFDNQDTGVPHNIVIRDASGTKVDMGDTAIFPGPETRSYSVAALPAGEYPFICEVHPTTMTGTLTVK